jgi:hypothetical protein
MLVRSPRSNGSARPLKHWREAFLAYFGTGRADNGSTEAIKA